MVRSAEVVVETTTPRVASYVEWGPIIAGAIAAAAVSFLLLTFGSALGLASVSPWEGVGIPGVVALIAAALWMIVTQAGSFAFGGYLAGRLRAPVSAVETPERYFRDGAHGFLVWALGILMGVVLAAAGAGALLGAGASVAGSAVQGASEAAGAVASVASPSVNRAVDLLLRPNLGGQTDQPQAAAAPDATTAAPPSPAGDSASASLASEAPDLRPEIGRIFATALDGEDLEASDREYLVRIVSDRTGATPEEAAARVDEAVGAGRALEAEAREALDATRKTAAIAAFVLVASLLISAVAAAAGAGLGGRHRDEGRTLRIFGAERLW